MADPLKALFSAVAPVSPDRRFATRLRARLERVLDRPEGVDMPEPTTPVGVVPYLAVSNGREALAWYTDALGAQEFGERYEEPGGRIGHAELRVHNAVFYLSDGAPELGVVPGDVSAPVATSLVLMVPDTDDALQRARDAGARVEREPQDNPYGRMAVIRDPYGHRWMLEGPVSAPSYERIRHGDIGYVSVNTPDAERAARFYAQVLGWTYDGGRWVRSRSLTIGLWEAQAPSTLFCCYAVDDVDAAVTAVRQAGGHATDPEARPYGRTSDCTDVEEVAFAVYQPVVGDDRRPAVNGERHGDLAYITYHVADSARARAFYGDVLGWRFSPGRVADGWGADGVAPMVGLSGGHDRAVTVPMWRVDDIDGAVERVRHAGGEATEPAQQPYGLMAECSDDQGGRFYLGQL